MEAVQAEAVQAVQLPQQGPPTAQFCLDLQKAMHLASWAGVDAAKQSLPAELLSALATAVMPMLQREATLVELQPSGQRVTVVGDTHGQFHDVCRLFQQFGHPSTDRIYIFNGDYVDRGAWGVETLALLLAWKWTLPQNVFLIRGNHESATVTRVYGFYAEMKAKYGAAAKGLYAQIRRLFACMPLAALVQQNTLILHGGLFRSPPQPKKGAGTKRRRSSASKALELGTLQHLRAASKGGQDPDPERSAKNTVASDVLWSDPVTTPGLRHNEARGCGTVWGPDVTEAFLSANGLKLIIRSHEGPDARDKRLAEDRMPSMDSGYAIDHSVDSGVLVTLFSAPDYPQFMAAGEERYRNQGAVLHLDAPGYHSPCVESFQAVLPRPQVESYYDVPGFTDDEDELSQAEGDAAEGTPPPPADAAEAAGEGSSAAAAQLSSSSSLALNLALDCLFV